MKTDWKAILGAVAPALATALGGPLAGTAAQILGASLLNRPEATEGEIAEVVASGDPGILARLKEIDAGFKTRMQELGIDLERINAADRASARDRETKLQDWTPRVLATLVTVGFFGTLAWIVSKGLPAEGKEAVLIMLGALGTAWTQIVAYYYGSSAGSAEKNQLIARLGEKP
ncbi:MAG: hypothetical protein IPL51_10030 [Candidatus Competibacteraceae bacterium]|nr:hypothetical protein [Candidatus Competibacteraceae bacterium]